MAKSIDAESLRRRITGITIPPPPTPPPEVPWEMLWTKIDAALGALNNIVLGLDDVISKIDALIRPPVIPAFDGRLDELVAYTAVPLHWGKATGGSLTSLTHIGMAWENNIWAGYECAIVRGSGAGQIRIVKSNNSNALTPTVSWDTKPDSTSVYVIRPSLRPISWASQQNVAVTANTDILSANISAKRASMLRLMCCFGAAGVFRAAITKGAVTEARDFNSGGNLVANALYIFDMLVDNGDAINFQYSVSTTLRLLRVQEIPLAIQ